MEASRGLIGFDAPLTDALKNHMTFANGTIHGKDVSRLSMGCQAFDIMAP